METNLTEIGIYPSGHYIVVVSSDSSPNGTSSLRKTKAGSSFEYTYNGKKYKLRFLTVTSSDVSSYAKASDCNILSSKVKSTIQKCLDTAIIAYISSFSKTLGTVASITGLSISNFGTAKTSTLRLNGASNWTRVYTQVWDASHKTWVSGSCVEYVQVLSYMSGSYYNKDKNRMEKVSQAEKRYKKYSGKYNDKTWRKKNAIAGYIHSIVNYNMTGDVAFYYGKSKKFTHKENF